MRLFIALDASPLKGELIRLQGLLTNQEINIRPVSRYHLTLHFLGEIDEPTIKKLQNKLSEIEFKPFSLTINHLGFFPPTGSPKVIWVGVEPEAKVIDLREEIAIALKNAGINPEKRFSPHLTLARVKQITNWEGSAQNLKRITVMPLTWNINKFFLIKSTLTLKGPVYENLLEIPLKGTPT